MIPTNRCERPIDQSLIGPDMRFGINLSFWRLFYNRLPTRDNLVKRDVITPDNSRCTGGCGQEETASHLLFQCHSFTGLWTHVIRQLKYQRCFQMFVGTISSNLEHLQEEEEDRLTVLESYGLLACGVYRKLEILAYSRTRIHQWSNYWKPYRDLLGIGCIPKINQQLARCLSGS